MTRASLTRWFVPALISVGVIAWLIWHISPAKLETAATALDWPVLAVLTGAMVLLVYLWDVVCMRWLYAQPNQTLSYRATADARAGSYLWSAFNYEVGQGVLAWKMTQIQNISLVCSLSRCVLLAVHDLALLLALALAGSLIDPIPRSPLIPLVLGGGLLVMALLGVVWKLLPAGRREDIMRTRWGNWLAWWRWRHTLVLCCLRLVYFGIMVVYADLALSVCGIVRDFETVCGVIPLVLLADALPSISGFGTRHAALESLLHLDSTEEAVVFHLSTLWSAGLMIGRAAIGLTNWWLVPFLKGRPT